MSFLIDPTTKTVTPWTPKGPFLESLRETIGCTQVDSIMIQNHTALWVDNFGLLRKPQRFFRFKDSQFRFAGKAVITATDEQGMPMPATIDPAMLLDGLDWCDGLEVVAVREELHMSPTDLGPWPRVVRITDFNQPTPQIASAPAPWDMAPANVPIEAPDEPAQPLFRWTVVSDDEADKFVASEAHSETGEPTGKSRTFKDMSAVVAFFRTLEAQREDLPADTPDEIVAAFLAPKF